MLNWHKRNQIVHVLPEGENLLEERQQRQSSSERQAVHRRVSAHAVRRRQLIAVHWKQNNVSAKYRRSCCLHWQFYLPALRLFQGYIFG